MDDNIFATQCIWWLASVIQYTERLKYYFEYQLFPSDYLRDCTVTPLINPVVNRSIVSEFIIPDLNRNYLSDIEQEILQQKSLSKRLSNMQCCQ